MKSMHNEVYPELTSVLQRFVVGVQDALGNNFLGAYLVGSLAMGDFDLDSDVDFLILTNWELSDAEVRSYKQHMSASMLSDAIRPSIWRGPI
jgi:predicted nucleotidyltransferase